MRIVKKVLFLFIFTLHFTYFSGQAYANAGGYYNFGAFDTPKSVEKTRDGGTIVAGMIGLFIPSNTQYPVLTKIDKTGKIAWRRSFNEQLSNGITNGSFFSAKETSTGEIIAVGVSNVPTEYPYSPPIFGYENMIVTLTGGSGQLKWQNSYNFGINNKNSTYAYDVVEVKPSKDYAGGFVVVGSVLKQKVNPIDTNDKYDADMLVVKLDRTGRVVWHKAFESFSLAGDEPYKKQDVFLRDIARSVHVTADGNLLIGTESFIFAKNAQTEAMESGVGFLKLDMEGNVLSKKSLYNFSTSSLQKHYLLSTIKPTKDDGYVATGSIQLSNDPYYTNDDKSWIAKLKKDGSLEWYKEYDHATLDGYKYARFNDIIQIADNNFILVGQISVQPEYMPNHSMYGLFIRTNVTGNILEQKKMKINDVTQFMGVAAVNNSFQVIGKAGPKSIYLNSHNGFIAHLDKNGLLGQCAPGQESDMFLAGDYTTLIEQNLHLSDEYPEKFVNKLNGSTLLATDSYNECKAVPSISAGQKISIKMP